MPRYLERQHDRMMPLLRVGLLAGAALFLVFAAWEAILAGRETVVAHLPQRLLYAGILATLAFAAGLPGARKRIEAILYTGVLAASAGVSLLSARLPDGRVFETGSLSLMALVLAVVAPTTRLAAKLAVVMVATVTSVMLLEGVAPRAIATTGFFVVPALLVAVALVCVRSLSDQAAYQAEHVLHEERERLAHLARTDFLTGAHNRRSFMSCGQTLAQLAVRHGRPCSLLLLDVDHFKRINDTYGHPTGDATLRTLTETVMRTLRDSDVFGRLGGEEFAALLPETDARGAMVLAERVRQAVGRAEVLADGTTIRFTVSLGIATFLGEHDDLESMLQRADRALYEAKRGGRDRVIAA